MESREMFRMGISLFCENQIKTEFGLFFIKICANSVLYYFGDLRGDLLHILRSHGGAVIKKDVVHEMLTKCTHISVDFGTVKW
ncbi:MAG: hypothetical protein E7662_10190 [Ruminococcaceae bacterium]|nr:hypothetical protein [Oscillospiraceae bacterium]